MLSISFCRYVQYNQNCCMKTSLFQRKIWKNDMLFFGGFPQFILDKLFHSVSQSLLKWVMVCTWIFAGSDLRGTTCVQIPFQLKELRTLNVAACSALPGVDSVPSAQGKTLVSCRMYMKQRFYFIIKWLLCNRLI